MKLLILFIALISGVSFAQEVAPVDGNLAVIFGAMGPILQGLVVKFPWLANIIGIMAVARLVIKPLMSALIEISKSTNFGFLKFLEGISDNKVYKVVSYLLDWVASIKLPKKKEEVKK